MGLAHECRTSFARLCSVAVLLCVCTDHGSVHDIVVGYNVRPIDGLGKILGSSMPLTVRSGAYPASMGQDNMPGSGAMEFDSADVVSSM